jgi:tRNA nucleotidyltransferase/poly(A) polymerase
MQKLISKLRKLNIVSTIENVGGNCYLVGGVVRDYMLGMSNKDIDLLVTGVPIPQLIEALKDLGSVDEVGKSFGVLKLNIPGFQEIDIAIPRTETKVGTGHTDFEVVADHNLPIELDLQRRDFTMNAIAVDMDCDFIDPFDGLRDIHAGIIRCVDIDAFAEDPLRILRAYQFMARFGFTIDQYTINLINNYIYDLDHISGERIIVEFEKMVNKGNPKHVLPSMLENGVIHALTYPYIESVMLTKYTFYPNICGKISSVGQLLFLMCNFEPKQDHIKNQKFYEFNERFRLSADTLKEFEALDYLYRYYVDGGVNNILNVYKAGRKYPQIFDTTFFDVELSLMFFVRDLFGSKYYQHVHIKKMRSIHENIQLFNSGRYPKSKLELKISSYELMEMGFNGKALGDLYDDIMLGIYQDRIVNEKKTIIGYIKKNY